MRQPTPTLPITPKMLRHFAVVTVAITACIGIFASGENTQVAAKPAKEAAQESGGFSFDFGGAERAALTGGGNKDHRNVNGINLASGTRLSSGSDADVGGFSSQASDSVGYIQNPQPTMRPSPAGAAMGISAPLEGNGLAAPTAMPPIPKDANGVPAPGAATINPAKSSKPQPPRKATQQEIERMMAASSQRAGGANTD